jgi:hypothetical protein
MTGKDQTLAGQRLPSNVHDALIPENMFMTSRRNCDTCSSQPDKSSTGWTGRAIDPAVVVSATHSLTFLACSIRLLFLFLFL